MDVAAAVAAVVAAAAAAAAFGAIINAAGRRGNRDSLGGRAKVWLMWVFVFRCLVVGW